MVHTVRGWGETRYTCTHTCAHARKHTHASPTLIHPPGAQSVTPTWPSARRHARGRLLRRLDARLHHSILAPRARLVLTYLGGRSMVGHGDAQWGMVWSVGCREVVKNGAASAAQGHWHTEAHPDLYPSTLHCWDHWPAGPPHHPQRQLGLKRPEALDRLAVLPGQERVVGRLLPLPLAFPFPLAGGGGGRGRRAVAV